MQIAHHLFQREEHGRDWSIERRRQRRRGADRHRRFHPARTRPSRRPSTDAIPEPTCTEGRSRPSAMPEARETPDRPNLPSTVRIAMNPLRRNRAALVCGMPATAGVGKPAGKQRPGAERADHRQQQAPPGRAARRIHTPAQVLCNVNEAHHHQSDDRADDQGQQQQDLVFVTANPLAVQPAGRTAGPKDARHRMRSTAHPPDAAAV